MEPDKHLREQLEWACRTAGVPGAALAILDRDGLTTAEAGVANSETAEPVGASTRFPIWSITKGYTASLIFQLIDEGKLGLDDPVVHYLPELRLAEASHAQTGEITIRQLLANTCGLSGGHIPETSEGEDALERYLRTLTALDLVHRPGERFSYSNPGFVLAGLITERLTGLTWDVALSERLLTPLGLQQTGSRLEQLGNSKLAAEHHWSSDGAWEVLAPWRIRSHGPAGTTMFATASDVARFGQHHLSVQWARLRVPQVEFPGPHIETWGLGWANFGWGVGVFGWDGVGPGARTFLRVLPEQGAAVALLANSDQGRKIYRSIMPALMAERFGVSMAPEFYPTLPADSIPEAANFVGVYRSGDWKQHVELTENRRALRLDGYPLLPTSEPGVYVWDDPLLGYPTAVFDHNYANISCFGFRREPMH